MSTLELFELGQAYVEGTLGLAAYLELLRTDLQSLFMDDGPHTYVMQDHFRGRSVHIDHRWERIKGGEAVDGMTIAHMKPGIAKEDVTTIQQARALVGNDANWKISNEPSATRMFADAKATEPRDWLSVEGVVEPGDVGGSKHEFGVFSIRDKGMQYYGAQRPYFKEFFLDGKKYQGRWIYRLIERKKPVEAKTRFLWQFGKPIDQEPYVLSRRAENVEWIPPYDVSALPPDIKKRIPDQHQYWKKRSPAERLETRAALRQAIMKKDVKLEPANAKYGYSYHFWKKREVIRAGPSAKHWYLFIEKAATVPLLKFTLYDDLLEAGASSALFSEESDHSWIGKEGLLKPGTKYNPTIDTPSWVGSVATGDVALLTESEDFYKFKCTTGKLKGLWIAKREAAKQNMFTVERSELPTPKLQEVTSDEVIKKNAPIGKHSLPGVYLVPTHARALVEGDKTLIISVKEAPEQYMHTPIYLVSADRVHAVIELTSQKQYEADHARVDLRDRHLVTDEEWHKWWPTAKTVWGYEFKIRKLIIPAKPFPVPQGVQKWLKEVTV